MLWQVVSCLTNLETLDLENNCLGPDGFAGAGLAGLPRVQCLNLAQNMLARLPDVIHGLATLRILDLTDNLYGPSPALPRIQTRDTLQGLAESNGGLCRLTDDGIPSSLTRLHRLKAIGLKRNALTRVPQVLGGMQSLQEIYLENNPTLEVRPYDLCTIFWP